MEISLRAFCWLVGTCIIFINQANASPVKTGKDLIVHDEDTDDDDDGDDYEDDMSCSGTEMRVFVTFFSTVNGNNKFHSFDDSDEQPIFLSNLPAGPKPSKLRNPKVKNFEDPPKEEVFFIPSNKSQKKFSKPASTKKPSGFRAGEPSSSGNFRPDNALFNAMTTRELEEMIKEAEVNPTDDDPDNFLKMPVSQRTRNVIGNILANRDNLSGSMSLGSILAKGEGAPKEVKPRAMMNVREYLSKRSS